MPIYEYLCEGCGKVNEKLQKVNDPPPARCDECGSRKLAKLVSRSAFQLKGGGWYSDLYASRKKGAPAADGAPASTATASAATPAAASGSPASASPATGASSSGSAAPAKAAAPPPAKAGKPGKGS